MKNKKASSDKTIKALRQLTTEFGHPTADYKSIYQRLIHPIVESPLLFNSYHWTTNISEQKLIHCAGVQRLLGYDEVEFDFQKSYSIIHPNFRPFVIAYGLMAYTMLSDKKYRPLSTRTHYSIQFPVARADGEYVLVQMTASVIQVDAQLFPIANYNRFEILGVYLGTPILIKPRVYFRTELHDLVEVAEQELRENVRDILKKITKMSPKECEVMVLMNDGLKNEAIAAALNLSLETVKTHCKNILAKAKTHLSPSFHNAHDVAVYLRQMDIV